MNFRPQCRVTRSVELALICLAFCTSIQAETLRVQKLGDFDEPATNFCARCAAGDYLISNGKLQVVIGGSHRRDESFYKFPTADALGSVIFVRTSRSEDFGDIMLGTPYLRIDNTTRHVNYDKLDIQQTDDRVTFIASGEYSDDADTRIRFEMRLPFTGDSEQLDISLTTTNVGLKPAENLLYALYFDPHQMYDFSPADVDTYRELRFRGYPRANQLFAWADPTPRQASGDYNWGWDGGMILSDPLPVTLQPGESQSRLFTLYAGADTQKVMGKLYQDLGVASETAYLDLKSESSKYLQVTVRETSTSAVFYRSFLDHSGTVAIQLPPGQYTAEANFFPSTAYCSLTVTEERPARCQLQALPTGQLTVRIVDSNNHEVPGKVSFTGTNSTSTPYFRPVNPSRSERYWESAKNSVFPINHEKQVTLAEGSYLVSASRGPEYTIDQQNVTITANSNDSLTLKIDKVINRPDLVSVDPHLHTLQSDGAVGVLDKVEALVASGVNVAIATDHNTPVDYGPALMKLGLTDYLTVLAGTEVTVPERLDYNTYPMKVEPDKRNNGAIDSLSTDLSALFSASRARDPGIVLQVNHPRLWQFDYFNWHGLDKESAAFAYEGLDLTFDVLEVVNSAIYNTPDNEATRNDWFNLMRRGYFFPLVGSSDSHEIDQDEPGFSRTYVYRNDKMSRPLETAQLMQQIREGHSFASNGPILDFTVNNQLPGSTITVANRVVQIQIDVWTAPWIIADQVQLYVDGKARQLATELVDDSGVRHRRATLQLQLDADAFLVAEVTGAKSLFPMLQPRGTTTESVLPYALTNPVFVDIDGNGKFDPPLPHKVELRPRP